MVVVLGKLPGVADVDAVGTGEMERLGDVSINAPGISVVRLENADTLSVKRAALARQIINLGVVNDVVDVGGGRFTKLVPAPGEGSIHEHGGSERTVITGCPVPCTAIPLGVRGGVVGV